MLVFGFSIRPQTLLMPETQKGFSGEHFVDPHNLHQHQHYQVFLLIIPLEKICSLHLYLGDVSLASVKWKKSQSRTNWTLID